MIFIWLVSITTFIQASITIIACINPAFKSLLTSSISSMSNYDETKVISAIGFAYNDSASLSRIQTTNIFSILLFVVYHISFRIVKK